MTRNGAGTPRCEHHPDGPTSRVRSVDGPVSICLLCSRTLAHTEELTAEEVEEAAQQLTKESGDD